MKKKLIILIFVTLLAFTLRIVKIAHTPPSLNWDEVSHGYNAYSILKTGMDEWGLKYPLIFRAYGDYKLPGYIYLLIPFIKTLGLNELSVRLPNVLAGTTMVLVTYFLIKELLKDIKDFDTEKIALIGSFLVAIEPWSLFLSRGAIEANLSQCFILMGIYLFVKGINSNHRLVIPSIIFWGLSVWTYNSARIFVPLFIVSLLFIYRNEVVNIYHKNKKLTVLYLLLCIVFFTPMLYQLSQNTGLARYQKVAIIDQGAIGKIIEFRQNSPLPSNISRIIFNKVTFFSINFASNWLSHFTPAFLFFKGGSNYQFSIPGKGILYLINMPFFYLGIYSLFVNLKKHKHIKMLLVWLLLAPVASSLTREAPHVLRSITILTLPMVLSAMGIAMFLQVINKWSNSFMYIYVIVIGVFLWSYLSSYFGSYKNTYSSSWQYGYKQAINFVSNNYDGFDRIIITKKYGEPHEFLLFFSGWKPSSFVNDQKLIRFEQSGWYWVDRFDKFIFVNDWDIPTEEWQPFTLESGAESVDCRDISCLLITSPGNFPKTWTKIGSVDFLNGETAFEYYKN